MGYPDWAGSLSEPQRRLVRDHLGLVGVHLRRCGFRRRTARADRERDDLFQEGCLGLIRAAADFRADAGIPFAAFALPRIHKAVSLAVQRSVGEDAVPRCGTTKKAAGPPGRPDPDRAETRPASPLRHPAFEQLPLWRAQELPDRRRTRPSDAVGPNVETIGDRLRALHEQAVRIAAAATSGTGRRGDRDVLVLRIVRDRLLIPDADTRSTLRTIARETNCSFARVAECEKVIRQTARRILESNPELPLLTALARRLRRGSDTPLGAPREARLAETSAAVFARRFASASTKTRLALLARLLDDAPVEFDALLRGCFRQLGPLLRQELLARMQDLVAEDVGKAYRGGGPPGRRGSLPGARAPRRRSRSCTVCKGLQERSAPSGLN